MIIRWVIYLGGRIYFNSFINDFSQELMESLKGGRDGVNVSSISLHFMAVLPKDLWIGCVQRCWMDAL